MKTRQEQVKEDCWDLGSFFESDEIWEKEFEKLAEEKSPYWPAIEAFKGRLERGTSELKGLLDVYFSLQRKIEALYTFAHLRHDEDLADDQAKVRYEKILSILHLFNHETAWIEPEILSFDEELAANSRSDKLLEPYHFYLEKIFRKKPHTLSLEQEELLALAQKPLSCAGKTFSALNNADFCFPEIKDQEGKPHELTHASYGLYLRHKDRSLRKAAYESLHGKFMEYQNTLAELFSSNIATKLFQAKARNYATTREAALFDNRIDQRVYDSLLESLGNNLSVLHRYINLRKQMLSYEQLHVYDLYLPLVEANERHYSYEEARDLVIDSVEILGKEYQEKLRKGLYEQAWVDRYENLNKRSGGYSSGCYDSHPYILLNYTGNLRDVFTLAHEAGHSMHSLLSREKQSYVYADYSIFVAEIASTFNEELLTQHLLKKATSQHEKLYLLQQKIEDIRLTLFRQGMFAQFEWQMHQKAQAQEPLTASSLKKDYLELNMKYFGSSLEYNDLLSIEWARIPHFYSSFYVYQYATGISAAIAMANKVLKTGNSQAYLNFLEAGASKYPLDLLQEANIEIGSAVNECVAHFSTLLDQFENEYQGKAIPH